MAQRTVYLNGNEVAADVVEVHGASGVTPWGSVNDLSPGTVLVPYGAVMVPIPDQLLEMLTKPVEYPADMTLHRSTVQQGQGGSFFGDTEEPKDPSESKEQAERPGSSGIEADPEELSASLLRDFGDQSMLSSCIDGWDTMTKKEMVAALQEKGVTKVWISASSTLT